MIPYFVFAPPPLTSPPLPYPPQGRLQGTLVDLSPVGYKDVIGLGFGLESSFSKTSTVMGLYSSGMEVSIMNLAIHRSSSSGNPNVLSPSLSRNTSIMSNVRKAARVFLVEARANQCAASRRYTLISIVYHSSDYIIYIHHCSVLTYHMSPIQAAKAGVPESRTTIFMHVIK